MNPTETCDCCSKPAFALYIAPCPERGTCMLCSECLRGEYPVLHKRIMDSVDDVHETDPSDAYHDSIAEPVRWK